MTLPEPFIRSLGSDNSHCFFILAAPRSGTTLLRLVLSGHPQLYVAPETWFFPFLVRQARSYGDFSKPEQVRKYAEDVTAATAESEKPVGEVFKISSEELAQVVTDAGARNYAQAYAAFMAHLARREGKAVWGEKTPYYTAYVKLLTACYPKARFIALIRDPRDTVASMLTTPWGRRMFPTVAESSLRWQFAMDGIEQASHRVEEKRWLALRYEDFVRDPAAWTRRLCTFLDVGFEPRMLQFQENGLAQVPEGARSWHQKLAQPISDANVGSWKKNLGAADTGLIELFCAGSMRRWGYPLEGQRFTPGNLLTRAKWAVRNRLGKLGELTWVKPLS